MQKVILSLWEQYLERCQIDQFKMPADQHREMKRAFFGAAGQVLIYMRDDVGAENEEKAAEVFQAMLDEVQVFWQIEMVTQDAQMAANSKAKPEPPKTFAHELTTLLNRYSKENGSNTPDYVLANFLQNSMAAFDLALNQREDHGQPDLVTRIKNKLRGAGREIMDEIENDTQKTAMGGDAKKAQALRELMNSPYGAALGKNAPEIVVGMKFLNEHQPGQLYTVVNIDTEKNSIDVGIQFQDRTWTDKGWDLQHTIWGFERGEYWKVPENTVIIKILESGIPGQPGKYAIQSPGSDVVPGPGGPWPESQESIMPKTWEDRANERPCGPDPGFPYKEMEKHQAAKESTILDEKGFFYYMKTGGIGWCRMYGGTPWFMAQTADGQWYTGKQVNQTDIWNAKASEVSADEDAVLRKSLPNE
jgi:hypothetical protein